MILCTVQGHTIEGTITSKKEIGDTEAVVSTLCEVKDETKVITFSTMEEIPEVAQLEVDLGQTGDEDEESIPEETVFLSEGNSSKKGGDYGLLRSMDDSDAVIMISPEDMAMMEQLMLQMDDDEELFDCGDEMRRSR